MIGAPEVRCLKLANGQEWQLIASERTLPWANKLFLLMGLKESELNDSPKMIFIDDQRSIDQWISTFFTSLPRDGWKASTIKGVKFWTHNEVPDIFCELSGDKSNITDVERFIGMLYPIYKKTLALGGFPFHAALVEYHGKGILLAARSTTGKSTCARRISAPWKAICDDETIIVKDNRSYSVHPIPTWKDLLNKKNGLTWEVQSHLPLSAIFFLEQSKDDRAVLLGKGKAAMSISDSVLQIYDRYRMWLGEDEMKNICAEIFDNSCALSNAVPSYTLRVSLTGKFWEEIEKVIL